MRWSVRGVLAALALAALGLGVARPQETGGAASPKEAAPGRILDDELRCPAIWYGSTACGCEADACRCACPGCTGGADCPCLGVLRTGTGTVSGAVKSPWFKRVEGAIFVRDIPDRKFALPRTNPVMDQKNLVYTPHVLPVLVGSSVDFLNSDEVRHNVYSTKDSAKVFNLGTYEAGVVKRTLLDRVGVVSLLCNVHAEMSAHVVVCQNPYFATVDKQAGTFTIRHVPAGTHRLAVFHEKVRAEDVEVTVREGKTVRVEFARFERK